MKKINLTLIATLIVVASVFADAGETKNQKAEKTTNAEMKLAAQKMVKVLENEAMEDFMEAELLQDFNLNQENAAIKVIDQNEKMIYEGDGNSKEVKRMILRSNFLNEVNGTRYYLFTR